ncbi:MAG: toxin-activating lysine-acyltransferase [Rhodospirillales bacterium]|nr:toxin-activating lysine-acyltransferase [Rhodospirillales bacterium]
MLGQLLLLFTQSPYYAGRSTGRLTQTVLPALIRGDFVYVADRGCLVAWASWAFVSDQVLDAIKAGNLIQAEDFDSGAHLLCLDFIAPFGHAIALHREIRRVHGARKAVWFRMTKGDRFCEVVSNGK